MLPRCGPVLPPTTSMPTTWRITTRQAAGPRGRPTRAAAGTSVNLRHSPARFPKWKFATASSNHWKISTQWRDLPARPVMSGYYTCLRRPATPLDQDGWLNTGDIGYLVDGVLTITGRKKDLIIIHGRNIWQDLEHIAEGRAGSPAR